MDMNEFGIGNEVFRLSVANHGRLMEAAHRALAPAMPDLFSAATSFAANSIGTKLGRATAAAFPDIHRQLASMTPAFNGFGGMDQLRPIVLANFHWNFAPEIHPGWTSVLEAVDKMRADAMLRGTFLLDLRGRSVELKAGAHPGLIELLLWRQLAQDAAAAHLRSWTRRRLRAPTTPPGRQQAADPHRTRGPNRPASDHISCGAGQAA